MSATKATNNKNKQLPQEAIVSGFNQLRQEQRNLASKSAELELDMNEHNLVIDTLKDVEEDRKCFRMIGGVLVERTVKEILPALVNNKEQIKKVIEGLNSQISKKGQEINDYREKHNIKVRGEAGTDSEDKSKSKENSVGQKSVLVGDSSSKS